MVMCCNRRLKQIAKEYIPNCKRMHKEITLNINDSPHAVPKSITREATTGIYGRRARTLHYNQHQLRNEFWFMPKKYPSMTTLSFEHQPKRLNIWMCFPVLRELDLTNMGFIKTKVIECLPKTLKILKMNKTRMFLCCIHGIPANVVHLELRGAAIIAWPIDTLLHLDQTLDFIDISGLKLVDNTSIVVHTNQIRTILGRDDVGCNITFAKRHK